MQNKTLRKYLFNLVLLSVVLVPLAIFPFANQIFSMAKMITFSTITFLAVIIVGIDALKAGQISTPIPNKFAKVLFFALGGYALSLMVSTITSVSPYVSFWGSYQRTFGLYLMLQFILFFGIVVYLRMTKKEIARVLTALAITSIAISVFGILQYFDLDLLLFSWNKDEFLGRIFATFGHPNFFGAFLVMTIPLSVSNIFKKRNSYVWVVGFFVQLSALFLTGNRGAWLGLFVVAVILLYLLYRNKKSWQLLICIITLLIIPFLILAFLSTRDTRSLSTRATMYSIGYDILREKPIFGHGPETFTTILPRHMTKDLLISERADSIPDRIHNEPMDTAISIGYIGLLFYYMLIFYILRLSFIQGIDPLALGIAGLVVANQFSFNTVSSSFLLWLFLGILAAKLCFGSDTKKSKLSIGSKLLVSLFILLSLAGLFYNQRMFFADYYYRQFLENRDEYLENIEKASELSPFLYPKLQLLNIYNNDADFHTEAEEELVASLKKKDPGLYQIYLLEGRLKTKNGEYEAANEAFSHGTLLAPMSLDLWRDWADSLHYSDSHIEAIRKYEHMLSLIPPYFEDKNSEPSRLFYKHNPNFNSVFVLLARSYFVSGDTNSALKYLRFADEDDVDALTTFAVIYGQNGQTEEALKYYRKALLLDPLNDIIRSSIESLGSLE